MRKGRKISGKEITIKNIVELLNILNFIFMKLMSFNMISNTFLEKNIWCIRVKLKLMSFFFKKVLKVLMFLIE